MYMVKINPAEKSRFSLRRFAFGFGGTLVVSGVLLAVLFPETVKGVVGGITNIFRDDTSGHGLSFGEQYAQQQSDDMREITRGYGVQYDSDGGHRVVDKNSVPAGNTSEQQKMPAAGLIGPGAVAAFFFLLGRRVIKFDFKALRGART